MMRTPLQLIEALGLAPALRLEELAGRRRAFESLHAGLHPLPIGDLLDLLRDEPLLKPPRTGHLGNWEEIALGRAGAMDFNQAICARGLGYPLIYCFTQTEAAGPSGDWVYLPGSLVDQGRRTELPLFSWDGRAFAPRPRDQALLCPLVQAQVEGQLVPLVELHWRRMQATPRFRFVLEAAVMVEHAAEVRELLPLLLEQASRSDNPRSLFQDLISHAVAQDGTVARCDMRREGQGYWLDDCFYPSAEDLVEHVLLLFQAVTEPRPFLARLGGLPRLLPVMSNNVARIFSILFQTHYPDAAALPAEQSRPFILHPHWGARDMAGYPPRQKGYFTARSRTRSFRIICETLMAHRPQISPICVLLLPAAVFMLCPTSAHPRDAQLLADLFRRVRAAPVRPAAEEQQAEVERVTADWLAQHAAALSPYFLNRFYPRRGILHTAELPAASEPLEPDGFRELTLQQACMLVGALVEMAQAEVPR